MGQGRNGHLRYPCEAGSTLIQSQYHVVPLVLHDDPMKETD